MKYKLTTYRTLFGTKGVLEIHKEKTYQWVIYQNDEPTYLVDCFDFKNESNLIMNNLILSERKSIHEIIKKIRRKKKIKLSLPKVPIFEIEVKSEIKELKLESLPEEWLN